MKKLNDIYQLQSISKKEVKYLILIKNKIKKPKSVKIFFFWGLICMRNPNECKILYAYFEVGLAYVKKK